MRMRSRLYHDSTFRHCQDKVGGVLSPWLFTLLARAHIWPEFVFLVDRSGSMDGAKMTAVQSSLQVRLAVAYPAS